MTNQEAIEVITTVDSVLYEAFKMAIKALEQEPSVEIVKTEESNDNGTKYLNINVSDDEVKRNPDIVRLCSDVGILEYAKPQTGHWIEHPTEEDYSVCSRCGIGCRRKEHGKNADGTKYIDIYSYRFCPNCGCRMVEPQESEEAKWKEKCE